MHGMGEESKGTVSQCVFNQKPQKTNFITNKNKKNKRWSNGNPC